MEIVGVIVEGAGIGVIKQLTELPQRRKIHAALLTADGADAAVTVLAILTNIQLKREGEMPEHMHRAKLRDGFDGRQLAGICVAACGHVLAHRRQVGGVMLHHLVKFRLNDGLQRLKIKCHSV